ncbi:MAG: hypothetical protein H7X92_01510 [Chitinophagales bacterium]|nr:hypothetical protein [Hyphomicrobiales bacterium]
MNSKAAAVASPIADKAAIKEISAIAMHCGGCGAKVGATVRPRALGQISPAERDDVVIGLAAPDDAAVDSGSPRLSAHTVDYFRAIVDDPYIFGKIAANHTTGRHLRHGRGAADSARHRHSAVWHQGEG